MNRSGREDNQNLTRLPINLHQINKLIYNKLNELIIDPKRVEKCILNKSYIFNEYK
jgi:hypothetical protein